MNQLGKELKLIVHMKRGTPMAWPIFLTWYLTGKNLPDINLIFLFDKKMNLAPVPNYVYSKKIKILYCDFNDDLNLFVKNTKNSFFNNSIFVNSYVFPLDVISDDLFVKIQKNTNMEDENGMVLVSVGSEFIKEKFIHDVRSNSKSTFVSIKDGWGNFNMSTWLNRVDNPLVYNFKNSDMSVNEVVFSKYWDDAGKISNMFY